MLYLGIGVEMVLGLEHCVGAGKVGYPKASGQQLH